MCHTGWKELHIRFCSGTCAEWKVGLPQMLIRFHLNAGIRQAYHTLDYFSLHFTLFEFSVQL